MTASATSGIARMHVKVALSVSPYTYDYEVDETLNNTIAAVHAHVHADERQR